MQSNTHQFHIHGMHCASCSLLIEETLKEIPGISHIQVNARTHVVTLVADGEKQNLLSTINAALAPHGYTAAEEKAAKGNAAWHEFAFAIPAALIFAGIFVLLQKLGILDLANITEVTPGTSFIVGLIASVSTCMAVVGGLLLSMSATFAKSGSNWKPQTLFHIGRIVSFAVLGGVIGALGASFALSTSATFILGLIIGVVMLVLGLNLLNVFHWSKKMQLTMPKFVARHVMDIAKLNHSLTPLLVGAATFFLPCGFTQSMQFATLSTGSFWSGAMIMLAFALGTLPVLALISFSSFSIAKKSWSGIFFKTAGLIVILFALLNIVNSMVVIGIIPPFLNL